MTSPDKINLYRFRETFKIPAANIRSIISRLKMEVIKERNIDYVVGQDVNGFTARQILTHAVLEFRETLDIKNTLMGNYTIYPVKEHNNEAIKEITPAVNRKPNRKPFPKITAPKSGNVGITQPSVSNDDLAPEAEEDTP